MHEGMLHIRDVEGPKKTGSMEARLEAMEQQVFKCQGMVERGLNANHMMITEFTNKHNIDAKDIWKHLSRLYDRIDHLQSKIYDLGNQNFGCKMHGSIPCNETPMSKPGDFVVILADLSRRVFGIEEPPVYVVHEQPTSDAIRYFWASVHIYGGNHLLECPHHFTGRATTNETQAHQLAAREAIVQVRHLSPWMNSRPFCYYPSRESYGSLTRVASEDQESDPAPVQVVRYLRAQEALIHQITSDLVMSRTPTARRTPTSYEAAIASNN
ncbi:40S ribosomal protein S5-1 [Hordeum vulgare]|nr:40S ribosomal protein S5-1 [Hordeum vulgare]